VQADRIAVSLHTKRIPAWEGPVLVSLLRRLLAMLSVLVQR
jgi:hypothetical protein